MSKISELEDGGSLLPTDFLIVVRSGGNVKVKADQADFDRIRLGDNEKIELGNSQDLTLVHTATQSIINQAGTGDLLIQKAGTTKASITANGLEFPDNSKAIFGAGSDLKIYHDGSNSFIQESGTGDLKIRSNKIRMEAPDSQNMIIVTEDAGVQAFYNGTERLSVTNTGIDVTGTVTADGLTVDGAADINGDLEVGSAGAGTKAIVIAGSGSSTSVMDLKMFGGGTGNPTSILRHSSATKDFSILTGNSGAELTRLLVTEGGDLSLYEDTGTTPKLFWDASAESLGIGTSSPDAIIETSASATGNTVGALLTNTNGSGTADSVSLNFGLGRSVDGYIRSVEAIKLLKEQQWTGAASTVDAALVFSTVSNEATSERMRIDASGNLLVGTTSATGASESGVAINPSTSSGYISLAHPSGAATGRSYALFRYNSGIIGNIAQSGTTAVLYNTTSDQRLKENIADADDAGSKIDAIQVRKFDWKADGSHQDYGMVAQELIEVAPEAVSAPEDPEEMMGVDYSKLVPMMLKEIQSLRARIAALES